MAGDGLCLSAIPAPKGGICVVKGVADLFVPGVDHVINDIAEPFYAVSEMGFGRVVLAWAARTYSIIRRISCGWICGPVGICGRQAVCLA